MLTWLYNVGTVLALLSQWQHLLNHHCFPAVLCCGKEWKKDFRVPVTLEPYSSLFSTRLSRHGTLYNGD